ncbi:MAG: hypothetical protein HZB42_05900 [Sphingobacteriales bacterium]|nr:hypothetical protein [Sphingobacteriales bacterium]
MNKILSLLLVAIISNMAIAQDEPKKSEINYSDPFQVDSSEYFLIPELIDDDNKADYGKGTGYLLWGNYANIFFYNAKTNQAKKLFNQLAIITSFASGRSYYDTKTSQYIPTNILPDHIIYLARTHNFNGDKALDSDDPVYLYLSSKNGENIRQITPSGFHVLTWTVSKDKKMILVKLMNDKTGNRKFGNGDNQLYYRIDLDADITKVKCNPISM